jgi:hypothetical protein
MCGDDGVECTVVHPNTADGGGLLGLLEAYNSSFEFGTLAFF